MSSPDFIAQESQFHPTESYRIENKQNPNNQQNNFNQLEYLSGDPSTPLQGVSMGMGRENKIRNETSSYIGETHAVFDENEQRRFEQRELEETERRRKITEKMELELKLKADNRERAIKFMNEFMM